MFFFFKQKTAYEMRISDWSSDVCSSDLARSYNASIAWFPVDQSGPEFIARIGEIECEVECKRQSEAIIDLLGRTESDALAGRIVQRIMEVGLRGRASIHVPDDFDRRILGDGAAWRSEEHTSELQSL